ncbi:hypothetical protein AFK68_11435 [Hydrocoleum sp. CS-953]|uniref:TIGR03985 family CRISPR-associated protein n=1 Tax=Hydrocoleum sp. CS-953 TaxID=1671698 RepID=UPI000BDBCDCC|nr:TIGR03985 family CRISPR-associated protein [Hydrocoleum sp. CS-953]OZH54360.1 hypothetical protein AFK68_11435 [Hydrocoleum sp. CS-953]
MTFFSYFPTPEILDWLALGRLGDRFNRSIRLWVLLNYFYGEKKNLAAKLPKNFGYIDFREEFFSPEHPLSDRFTTEQIKTECPDENCICKKSIKELIKVEIYPQSVKEWQQKIRDKMGGEVIEIEQRPFATVHRTIRDDLKYLAKLGWLQKSKTQVGEYHCQPQNNWPQPPLIQTERWDTSELSSTQSWELLKILESLSFVQPNLELVVESLWEKTTQQKSLVRDEPQKRIFIHLDYILSDETQDRVDNYHQQIEELWHQLPGGVIKFKYWRAKTERELEIIVYPVCLHYARRAKYLTAFGKDTDGKFGWHNYRLDRIVSEELTILKWGNSQIPKKLSELWKKGKLPTVEFVEEELEKAWGFNFYLPRDLLIMRFEPKFARGYVDGTVRHETFKPIKYQSLSKLVQKEIKNPQKRQKLLNIIKARSPKDAYYWGWIRNGDINVLMRLRDWRPKGEVIAPISIREKLKLEAEEELANYD